LTSFPKIGKSKSGLRKGPFLFGQIPGLERKDMFLAESGRFFQVPGDKAGGGTASKPMESMVPEGAIIPKDTIPPETQVAQVDLDKAAEARGKLIEQLG